MVGTGTGPYSHSCAPARDSVKTKQNKQTNKKEQFGREKNKKTKNKTKQKKPKPKSQYYDKNPNSPEPPRPPALAPRWALCFLVRLCLRRLRGPPASGGTARRGVPGSALLAAGRRHGRRYGPGVWKGEKVFRK